MTALNCFYNDMDHDASERLHSCFFALSERRMSGATPVDIVSASQLLAGCVSASTLQPLVVCLPLSASLLRFLR